MEFDLTPIICYSYKTANQSREVKIEVTIHPTNDRRIKSTTRFVEGRVSLYFSTQIG